MRPRDLMVMNVRAAVVGLAFEVEATLRLVEQLPEERPSAEDVANLRQLTEFRNQQVHREVQAVQGALAGLLSAELLLAEQKADS